MKKTAAVSLLAAEVALLTSVRMAAAAETPAEPSNMQLEEIIVVAQRKEQSVLDVPVSASVFTSEAIETAGFDDAKDYLLQTPNVSFMQGGSNGAREIIISIRGIADLKGSEKVLTQSAFATYIDEFAPGRFAMGQPNPDNYDIEAIEVLRGPQGVFFGRNAEGGALNYRYKKPTQDFYGRVDAGIGRFNTYSVAGVVNGPLSESLSGRVSVYSEKSDGALKNRHPAGGGSNTEFLTIRGQVRWEPTDATTVDLHVNHVVDDIGMVQKIGSCIDQDAFGLPYDISSPELLGGVGCYDANGEFSKRVRNNTDDLQDRLGGLTLDQIRNNRDSLYQDGRDFTNNTINMAIAKVEHTFGDSMALTSITGYSDSNQDQFLDLDRSGIKAINRKNDFDTHSWSQELRLSSIGDRTIDWTIGGLYYKEVFNGANAILIETTVGRWVPGDKANENELANRIDGWGVYGNIEWHMTDTLSLIAGARFSRDHAESEWQNVYAACNRRPVGQPLDLSHVADGDGPCELTTEQQLLEARGALPQYWGGPIRNAAGAVLFPAGFRVTGGRYKQPRGAFAENDTDDVSPRLALNWRPSDDTSLYASVAKGNKPGGGHANPDGGDSSTFDDEKLWNYEIGGNAYFFDRRMLVQGAVFYMDWKDYQFLSRQTFCTLDDGSVTTLGPDDNLDDCASLQRRDSTQNLKKAVSKGIELTATGQVTDGLRLGGSLGYNEAEYKEGFGVVDGEMVDLAGKEIGNTPKITASATVEQTFRTFGGESTIGLNWSYRGEAVIGVIEKAESEFPDHVDAISLLNLRLSQKFGKNRIALNVDNLTNEEYYTASVGFSFVGPQLTYNPRTWSVRWTSEFE